MSVTSIKKYKDGDIILRPGDRPRTLFKLLAGGVIMYANYGQSNQHLVGSYTPPFCFAETAVLANHACPYTIIASGKTVLMKIPKKAFADFIRDHPKETLSIMTAMAQKLSKSYEVLDEFKALQSSQGMNLLALRGLAEECAEMDLDTEELALPHDYDNNSTDTITVVHKTRTLSPPEEAPEVQTSEEAEKTQTPAPEEAPEAQLSEEAEETQTPTPEEAPEAQASEEAEETQTPTPEEAPEAQASEETEEIQTPTPEEVPEAQASEEAEKTQASAPEETPETQASKETEETQTSAPEEAPEAQASKETEEIQTSAPEAHPSAPTESATTRTFDPKASVKASNAALKASLKAKVLASKASAKTSTSASGSPSSSPATAAPAPTPPYPSAGAAVSMGSYPSTRMATPMMPYPPVGAGVPMMPYAPMGTATPYPPVGAAVPTAHFPASERSAPDSSVSEANMPTEATSEPVVPRESCTSPRTSAKNYIEELFPSGHQHYPGITYPEFAQYIYSKEYTCPHCMSKFDGVRISYNKLTPSTAPKHHNRYDLRIFYDDFKPEWYEIITCPYCYFSTYYEYFHLTDLLRKRYYEEDLEKIHKALELDFLAERDLNFVFAQHYLTLLCSRGLKNFRQINARMWENLIWLYEDIGDTQMSHFALEQALTAYQDVYEQCALDPVQDQRTCMTVAGMLYQLGDFKKAREWALRVRTNRMGKKAYSNLAEKLIDDIRDELDQIELAQRRLQREQEEEELSE